MRRELLGVDEIFLTQRIHSIDSHGTAGRRGSGRPCSFTSSSRATTSSPTIRYVNDPSLAVGRVTNFSNWGDAMHRGRGQTVLCAELSCNYEDAIWGRDGRAGEPGRP